MTKKSKNCKWNIKNKLKMSKNQTKKDRIQIMKRWSLNLLHLHKKQQHKKIRR